MRITSKSQIFERQLNPNLSTDSRSCNIRLTAFFPGVGETEAGIPNVAANRTSASNYMGHVAFNGDQDGESTTNTGATLAICMFPTIEFDIIGYPESSVNPDQNNYGISIANKTITELDPTNYTTVAENTQGLHSQLKAR